MHALDTRPETVAIVGMGPSCEHYYREQSKKKNIPKFDEVWVVNGLSNGLKADKVWIMDDLKSIEKEYPEWALRLRDLQTPIVTCRAYPEYPSSVAFPIDAVRKNLKDDYLSVTPAYMVAYAIHIGSVRTLYIYGCDFYYPGNLAIESGSACVAYWLGIARERRIIFRIPQTSTLLDAHLTKVEGDEVGNRYLYGYDYNPGRSYERIQAGQATELDHKVAIGGKIHTIQEAPKSEGKNAEPKAP